MTLCPVRQTVRITHALGLPRRHLLTLTSCILGAAWLPRAAQAQAVTHPNLNAQLLVAARQNDVPAVRRALAQGASPQSRNRLGKTALLMAAEKGQATLLDVMLEAGTDVNLASLEGVTPLMHARRHGYKAITDILTAAGGR